MTLLPRLLLLLLVLLQLLLLLPVAAQTGSTGDAAITSRPKTGCPYLRALQNSAGAQGSTADAVIAEKDLAPLRGVADGVARFVYSTAPRKPANAGLDLDALSKQRHGPIEHPGSISCSPEHVVDGEVRAPRKDSSRLPLLLELLRQGDSRDEAASELLTYADLPRLSRLALALDEQFFVAKYGTASAMDAGWARKNVVAAAEVEAAYAHLADDAGNVKTEDLIAFFGRDQLSTAVERTGGKKSVPVLLGRWMTGLATRMFMPYTDAKYKSALGALRDRASAEEGGSLLDLDTGLVRRR